VLPASMLHPHGASPTQASCQKGRSARVWESAAIILSTLPNHSKLLYQGTYVYSR